MRAQPRSLVAAAARIAARQHGNVTRAQLLEAGVDSARIGRWVANGLLHREFRAVYRFGHNAPSLLARCAAAVLAAGPGAALCGLAAARLLELLRHNENPPPEVIVAADREIPGLVVRRARALDPRDVTSVRGIPCTGPARTLADIAGRLPIDALADAHHQADVRWALRPEAVLEVLDRRPTTPGAARLRAVADGDSPVLLSRLERGFRALLRRHGFPPPLFNRREGARYIDCRWPQLALTVELDSYRYHRTRKAWKADLLREREARARGDTFRRFVWDDVFADSRYLVAELTALLHHK